MRRSLALTTALLASTAAVAVPAAHAAAPQGWEVVASGLDNPRGVAIGPRGAVLGTLVFGFAEAVAIQMQSSGSLAVPNEVFIALPYLLTIALTVARRRFSAPDRLGVAYDKQG